MKIRKTTAVILAAGKGTRMKSHLPKVLHPLMGRPIITYVIDACKKAKIDKIFLVIGYGADEVRETLGSHYNFVEQKQQLGTGHAVMTVNDQIKGLEGDILILAADAPFLTGKIIRKLINRHQKTHAAATLMTTIIDPPPPYGRIVRDSNGKILRIVEDRDASSNEKKITEVNTSHYCFQAEKLFPLLSKLNTANDQGEYYLTDVIELLSRNGEWIEAMICPDPNVLRGINDRKELAEAHQNMRNEIIEKHCIQGVSFIDTTSVYIEPDVKIGKDTVIHPFTNITGRSVVGENSHIGPHVKLKNAIIGKNCKIEFSVIENRRIEDDAVVGPFASISGET